MQLPQPLVAPDAITRPQSSVPLRSPREPVAPPQGISWRCPSASDRCVARAVPGPCIRSATGHHIGLAPADHPSAANR
jgi:hypothetical protein